MQMFGSGLVRRHCMHPDDESSAWTYSRSGTLVDFERLARSENSYSCLAPSDRRLLQHNLPMRDNKVCPYQIQPHLPMPRRNNNLQCEACFARPFANGLRLGLPVVRILPEFPTGRVVGLGTAPLPIALSYRVIFLWKTPMGQELWRIENVDQDQDRSRGGPVLYVIPWEHAAT
jgi:hypothetical protein